MKSNLIVEKSQKSIQDGEGAPIRFRIQAWDDGHVVLAWIRNKKVIDTVEMCVDGFFRILISLPNWFSTIKDGEASVYASCGSDECDTSLVCAHSPDYPEIILAVINSKSGQSSAWVSLPRGAVLTMFDEVGFALAALPDAAGCSRKQGITDTVEQDAQHHASPDPFQGVDMSVRH